MNAFPLTVFLLAIFVATLTPAAAADAPKAKGFTMRLVADKAGDDTEELAENRHPDPPIMLHVKKEVMLDRTSVESAFVSKDLAEQWVINVSLTDEGGKKFAKLTREYVGERLAIVVGGKLLMAPVIRDEIPGGKLVIAGKYSEKELRAFAAEIGPAQK